MLTMCIINKGLIFGIYKEILKMHKKKPDNSQLGKGLNKDVKEKIQRPKKTWKGFNLISN